MTTPIERNARALVGVLVQYFPGGATCEDLRRQFEKETGLVRQSFYNCLKHAKAQGWLVGGGNRWNQNQLYNLNPDNSWKEPESSGEAIGLDKDRLEYLVDSQARQINGLQSEVERLLNWSSGSDANEVGVALPSLVRIVGDSAASTRQRLKAAAAVLSYKANTEVTEFVKRFLGSLCVSTEISNIDYKIEAGELLRRHESPRVAPETVRPTYTEPEPEEPPIPLKELVRQRRERQDRMEREAIESGKVDPVTGHWKG